MINLSTMMGHISGKSVESAPNPGASAGGEAGASGAFAALVQLVTQTGQAWQTGQAAPIGGDPDVAAEAVSPESKVALMDEGGESGGGAGRAGITPPPARHEGVPWRPLADARATPPGPSTIPATNVTPDVEQGSPGVGSDERHYILPSGNESPAADAGDTGLIARGEPHVVAMQPSAPVPDGSPAVASAAPWGGQAADSTPLSDSDDADAGNNRSMPVDAGRPFGRIAAAGEARRDIAVNFSVQPAVATPLSPAATAPEGELAEGADAGRHFHEIAPVRESAGGGGIAPAGAGSAGPGSMPLRMIVDSLPPVVQSTLAGGTVATVSGPSTGQQLGDQVIDMGVAGQWIDRMAREITALAEGGGHSRFTLNPPHLGRLQVDLWQGQDATSVRFVAETDEAARRLGEGRAALHADARLTALNLASITIEKSALPHESPRDGGGQAQQQAAGQGQAQGQQARAGRDEAQGERSGRPLRDEQDQQGGAAPRRVARDHVRFA